VSLPSPHATLAIVGAGARGRSYARLARAEGARIVAVAEPDPLRRARFAAEHGIAPALVFATWQELLATERVADAVVIATADREHTRPAIAAARRGYHLLLEKPMAPTEPEAVAIVEAVQEAGVFLVVCHVLRYTAYTAQIKELVTSGRIGKIASVEHLEPIGWWHFAHSYVRGSWAREAESSSMLLAKSSHDIDWLSYVIDEPVSKVSSFGSLLEFRPEMKPAGAAARCVECPVEPTCAYSAPRIYQRFLGDPVHEDWPLGVLTPDVTPESLDAALREGPFGRCVYDGFNDVVDHQVVSLEYASGATASFTVTAFTELDFRKTRIFGTRGTIEGDGRTVWFHDFLTDSKEQFDFDVDGTASAADGHGGADTELIRAFLRTIAGNAAGTAESPADSSLTSHRIVWAAEESRRTGRIVTMRHDPSIQLSSGSI
jgi:predicted dehydrogenase